MGPLCSLVLRRCSNQLSLCSARQRSFCEALRGLASLRDLLGEAPAEHLPLHDSAICITEFRPDWTLPLRVPNGLLVLFCGAEVLEQALALLRGPALFLVNLRAICLRSEACLAKLLQSTFPDMIPLSASRSFVLIGPLPLKGA